MPKIRPPYFALVGFLSTRAIHTIGKKMNVRILTSSGGNDRKLTTQSEHSECDYCIHSS